MFYLTYFFYGMPTIIWGGCFFTSTILMTILILKLCNLAFLEKYKINPSLNATIVGIGKTIFAVMLAMITIDVLGKFAQAQHNTLLEANSAGNIFRFSQNLQRQEALAISKYVQEYLNYVLNIEIPAQDQTHLNIDNVKAAGYDYIEKILTLTLQSQGADLIKS